ncbi:MAG: hypothetical protein D6824_00505 [Planctomycetota bacterium]|nr:MAG: hypothetical protein D6824_00505 [Planctomycetota bacterium]
MKRLEQALKRIQEQLKGLSASQKLLIASLSVILLMTLFLVSQYAGSKTMVPLLPGAPPEQQQSAQEFLQVSNIAHRMRNGEVYVPPERKHSVLAMLSERGALPDDTTVLFNNLIEKQSWTMPESQRRQLHTIALQNELARVISNFRNVRSAMVVIDAPERPGLGAAARLPTASATVFTEDGSPLSQSTVDAIAHLIAGAKAGLDPSRVRVIDGSTNQQRRARSEEDAVSGAYIEYAARIEKRYRDKLLDMLSYIEGVVVAVTAHVDVKRSTTNTSKVLAAGEGTQVLPERESEQERTENGASRGAEPGVRSNTGLDIASGQTTGERLHETVSETTNRILPGTQVEHVVDPGGAPTRVNATINVPRSYFVRLWRQGPGKDAASDEEPDEAALEPIVTQEIARIKASVEPIVAAATGDDASSEVVVSMAPDPPYLLTGVKGSPGTPAGSVGGGVGGLLAGGWLKTTGLGALALVSVGLMALSLRKATQKIELPTPEDLVGLPPALRTEAQLVGEVDETDEALAGLELSDEDVETRKKLEQVQELVNESPQEAATLLRAWMHPD